MFQGCQYITFVATLLLSLGLSVTAWARNIYLNGVDISSARHQSMENVNLRIDGNGNVFVEANQYQVNEESTFTPLSKWRSEANAIQHQELQGQKMDPKAGAGQPVEKVKTQDLPKLNTPAAAAAAPTPTPVAPAGQPRANDATTPPTPPPAGGQTGTN